MAYEKLSFPDATFINPASSHGWTPIAPTRKRSRGFALTTDNGPAELPPQHSGNMYTSSSLDEQADWEQTQADIANAIRLDKKQRQADKDKANAEALDAELRRMEEQVQADNARTRGKTAANSILATRHDNANLISKEQRKAELAAEMRRLRKQPKATTFGQLKNLTLNDWKEGYHHFDGMPVTTDVTKLKRYLDEKIDLRGAAGSQPPPRKRGAEGWTEQLSNVTIGDMAEQARRNAKTVGNAAATVGGKIADGVGNAADFIRNKFTPKPKTLWEKIQAYGDQAYSRSREFIKNNPEVLYGAGGALAGMGIGAMLSPKRRLLGSLIGALLGGGAAVGGKYLYDRYNA